MEFNTKQQVHRFLYSKVTIVLMICFVAVLIPGVYGIYSKAQESDKDRQVAEREFDDLKQRQESLQEKVEYGQTDRGMEEEIRGKFNVAKTGESVIVLVEKPVVASTSEEDASVFKTMWNKIKKAF